jgi:hypothetical protein
MKKYKDNKLTPSEFKAMKNSKKLSKRGKKKKRK